MPPNPMMPRQPMNPLPPPMPVPPIAPPQAAGTFPVSANKRKRFGDSLETMLSRPPMVASDQMGDMNVFTGQMMNTAARRPVVQMRGGGNVGDMYKKAYSSPAFTSYTASKSSSRPSNVRSTGSMTHDQLMSSIRGGSSPNDDKPAPVAVTRDDDYTPTSAELNEQMKDLAALGMPDLRQDQSDVYMPQFPDLLDRTRDTLADYSAFQAMVNKYGTQGDPDDRATILAPGTGGLSSVPSTPSAPVGSGMNPANVYIDPLDPFGGPGPDISISPPDPRDYVGSGMNPLTAYGPTSTDAFIGTGPDISAPKNYVGSGANPLTAYGPTSSDAFLGTGDPLDLGIGEELRPKIRPEDGGQGGTGTGEDKGFVEKFKDDARKFGSSFVKDLQMGIAAGLFGSRATRYQRLIDAGYSAAEANDFLDRSEDTMKKMMDKQAQQSAQDDDSPMSTSPVDPCPEGFKLDPASGICVPIEEAEEEGPSLDLNRTRDDEFNELDDIMKRIVKPIGDVRAMQAGGSVGLNRAADNFLAAMGA